MAQGHSFFVPLFWLPETRETVFEHIPNEPDNYGFESAWKSISEEKKLVVLDELGAKFDRMDGERLKLTWQRIADWGDIGLQLSLLDAFLGQGVEGFHSLAFPDPTLRPAYKWTLDSLGLDQDSDTKNIGDNMTSTQLSVMYPHLIQHLLDTPEKERLECFSRLFARIAATKSTKAEPQR